MVNLELRVDQDRTRRVRLLVPYVPTAQQLLPWLVRIDETRRYTNFGPLSRLLEARLAAFTHAAHAVAVANGTLGLELALGALRLPPCSHVLLPALTFAATGCAIRRAGHVPLFCYVDPETGVISPHIARDAAARCAIGAVVPVALFGHAHDPEAWDAFTAETGIPVVIDAAGGIAYQRPGRTSACVFSLHATKPLPAGEGGLVAADAIHFVERVRAGSNFGLAEGASAHPGTNGKMSEYHAAIALAALETWPYQALERLDLYQEYQLRLGAAYAGSQVAPLTQSGLVQNFCVRLERPVTEDVVATLAREGIETRRWYWPALHRHPAFADCPRASEPAAAQWLADRILGLPFHLGLDREDVALVVEALCEVVA